MMLFKALINEIFYGTLGWCLGFMLLIGAVINILPNWVYIVVYIYLGLYVVWMIAAITNGKWCNLHKKWEPKIFACKEKNGN